MSYGHKIGLWALVMLDDDLQFRLAGFNDEDKKIFRKAHPEELEEYFVECYKKCLEPNVGKVSFSQEFFNTTVDEWAQNKDSAATHFVNLKTQKLSGASFLLPLDERRFELETIEKGFELWANTMISVKKLAKHGVGGDSAVSGRGARIESALKYLSETYPRFVKIRKSTNSAYIQNYGTDLAGTFHYANMWKAVKRGEDVRK
jgi:hypothetical protein